MQVRFLPPQLEEEMLAQKWKLDPGEVGYSWSGGSSCVRGARRRMRAVSRSCRVHLVHLPTGLGVESDWVSGPYTKKQVRMLKQDLKQRLFRMLEDMVARHLRIAGR